MSKITVTWEASDGYVGSRPQRFKIDIDEMADNCETEEEARDWLSNEVQEDFTQKVSFDCTNEDEVIAAWRAARTTSAEHK